MTVKFQQRHYEAAVEAVTDAYQSCDSMGTTASELEAKRQGVMITAKAFADMFARDNSKFSRDRYARAIYKACGLQPWQ